jgi:WD40 repeat protein
MNPATLTEPDPPPCAECGAPIPASTLGGLCPCCLLTGLWEEVPERGEALFCLEGHEVLRELGRGGMGIVYLARQLDPPREVALKMLLPNQGIPDEMRERFRREAATVAALEHPGILPIYATGEHDDLPWFTLKLASGGTLAERVTDYRGRPREAAALLATLAEAVHFAHQRGVLHRDLKPGNIMFDAAGAAYVSDFGLAKWISGEPDRRHSLTIESSTLGTPHYLSPEAARQGAAAATAASDIYALGAICYELLAGTPPFTAATTPELMRRIYEDPVPRLPSSAPRDLAAVVMKCLEKAPAQRYDSALALAAELRSWLDGRGVQARPAGPAARLGRWARRSPALAGTAAALLIALGTGAGLQMRANRQLRGALAESLLSQAGMTSLGTELGARDAALSLLRQADGHGAASSPLLTARRRRELTAALALPELSQKAVWSVPSLSLNGGESFSPDLDRYLAATADGGFALYDTATRGVIKTWPPAESERPDRLRAPALRLNLSPDETLAAVIFAGDSNVPAMLRIVSLTNGRTLGQWPCLPTSREWPLWLPDGGFLFGNTLTPCLRGGPGGENVRPFPDPARAADCLPLALHPDGSQTIVGLRSAPALAALSLTTNKELWRTPVPALPGPTAWSADGTMLAAGERNSGTGSFGILLFDAASGAPRGRLAAHATAVAHLCFLHGSRSVVSVSEDQGLVWQDTQPGGFSLKAAAQPRLLHPDRSGTRLAWSPAQGAISIAGAVLPSGWRLWPENAGLCVTCSAVAAQGTRLYISTREDIQIWDTAKRLRLTSQPWPQTFTKSWPWFQVPPDGRQIVIGDQDQPLHLMSVSNAPDDGTLLAVSGPPEPRGPGRDFFMIHGFTAQGGWVVSDAPAGRSVQRDRNFFIWPGGDHSQACPVARQMNASGMQLLGPDARWGLGASQNGAGCTVWDLQKGILLGTIGSDEPLSVGKSPDFGTAALAGRERITLWHADTQVTGASWPSPPDIGGHLPLFSPDNRLLAVHDRSHSVHLFHIPSGAPALTLSAPGSFAFRSLHWTSPRQLIGIGRDGHIISWDLHETAAAAEAAGLAWPEF